MSAPQVRMDKSRDFATVHGERLAGDPHVGVHFYQDGLPFDSSGILVADHIDLTAQTPLAEKLRKRVARKLEKAAQVRPARESDPSASADDDEDDETRVEKDEEDDEDDRPQPANLEAWARGEVDVPWQEVTQAIAKRFSKRVSNKRDALELLIEERVVAVGALSVKNRRALED